MISQKYYDILGVNRNTSENDIKIAYRLLAKKYHPDLNKEPDAKERFIEIQKAYEKLLNPEIESSGIFDSLFKDGEIYLVGWKKLVDYEDFNLNREIAICGQYLDLGHKTSIEEEENYKKYRWATNKTNALNRIFLKNLNAFSSRYIKSYSNIVININIQGIKDIILHLNKVLRKEVNIKEKIKKPINPIEKLDNGYMFYKVEQYQKLIYNTMNQFHPKFLNKLPNKVQIYVNKVMRYLIIRLEKELKELEVKS